MFKHPILIKGVYQMTTIFALKTLYSELYLQLKTLYSQLYLHELLFLHNNIVLIITVMSLSVEKHIII